jgi:predicted nucleic acid-binding protein
VLFDTNIVLDLLLDRAPFSDHAAILFAKVEHSEITAYLCATTITTVHYLLHKALDKKAAIAHIQTLVSLCEIAPVNRVVIEQAINVGFSDFEDAVLYEAARHAGAAYIVTRNVADFQKPEIPVYDSKEFLSIIHSLE